MKRNLILVTPLLLALAAIGCGEQKEKATAETAVTEAGPTTASSAALATTGTLQEATTTKQGEEQPTTGETLPPDVVASAPDTLAIPGSVVVISALGSPDVTTMTLVDGAGGTTPLIYDTESNLWRVSYRVPVRSIQERIGLSVTASTEAGRWKRVWVFLRLRGTEQKVLTAPDSTR